MPVVSNLQRKAVTVLVQNEWLIRVKILSASSNDEKLLTVLLSPSCSVAELKSIIQQRLGIHPKEQRLSVLDTNEDNTATRRPLLYGALGDAFHQGEQQSLTLQLQQVPLDPRLEALFEMTGYGDVNERDEIMAKMITPREAQRCPGGHNLILTLSLQPCAVCAWAHVPGTSSSFYSSNREIVERVPMECNECDFVMCTECWQKDTGRSTLANEDPYKCLERTALNVGDDMARTASWFGGKGHFCGHPHITLLSEYANARLRQRSKHTDDRGIVINHQAKIIPNGFRLVVRLDDNARAILVEKGGTSSLASLEVDQVRASGAITHDIIDFREALPRSRVWPIVANEMQNRFPFYQTIQGEPASAYVTMKMVSFTFAEAVYEIGANISNGDY